MLAQGMDAVGNSRAEFAGIYDNEIARWGKVVKSLGPQVNWTDAAPPVAAGGN